MKCEAKLELRSHDTNASYFLIEVVTIAGYYIFLCMKNVTGKR